MKKPAEPKRTPAIPKEHLEVKKAPPPQVKEPAPIDLGARPTPEAKALSLKDKSRIDTLVQFAAVELDATIQKN